MARLPRPAVRRLSGAVPTPGGPLSYIHWGPIVAGAVVAAATSFVLMAFAAALGLSVASPSPTWRDTSVALALLSGLWVLIVAVGSLALGGYLAGRVRSSWATNADEIEFRDARMACWYGLWHLIGGLLAWVTAAAVSAAAPAPAATDRAAPAEPSYLALELDRLYRSERRPERADPDARAEAGRIILTGVGRRDIAPEDRAQLVRLVTARTGLAQPDADRRVTQIVAEVETSGAACPRDRNHHWIYDGGGACRRRRRCLVRCGHRRASPRWVDLSPVALAMAANGGGARLGKCFEPEVRTQRAASAIANFGAKRDTSARQKRGGRRSRGW